MAESTASAPKMMTIAELLTTAENLKKKADLLFAKQSFETAIETYGEALNALIKRRGSPDGEITAMKCFSNQAACLIKMKEYEKAVKSLEIAISIPSSNLDLHMYSKLWHRRAICQEALGNLPHAVYSLDRAIGIIPNSEEFLQYRDKLIGSIVEKHGVVPLPDLPAAVSETEIEEMIKMILQCGAQPQLVMPKLEALVAKRGHIDTHVKDGKNLMWAVCQAAVMRAARATGEMVKKAQKAAEEAKKKKEEEAAARGATAGGADVAGATAAVAAASVSDEGSKKEEEEVKEKKEGDDKKAAAGADGDKDKPKEPPLIEADDVFPVLELLIKSGAKSEQRYVKDGNKTPLQLMALAGARRCCRLLLATGATVFTVDDQQWSPLLVACSPNGPCTGRNADVVHDLLEAKAEVNHTNLAGVHALSLACQSGDIKSIIALLSRGCKINLRCKMGFSPIVWTKIACRNPMLGTEICKMLLETAEGVKKTVPQLVMEMKEDMQCCDTNNMISKLGQGFAKLVALKKEQDAMEPSKLAELPSEQVVKDVGRRMLEHYARMFNIPADFCDGAPEHTLLVDPKGRCNNIYEMMYVHFMAMAPKSLSKRWRVQTASAKDGAIVTTTPNPPAAASAVDSTDGAVATADATSAAGDKESSVAASAPAPAPAGNNPLGEVAVTSLVVTDSTFATMVKNAHPLEQCWLNILLTASAGPDPSNPPPVVDVIHAAARKTPPQPSDNSSSMNESEMFYQHRIYEGYVKLVEQMLVTHYSAVIPVTSTLEFIITTYHDVLVVDRSKYWTQLLNLYHQKKKQDAIKAAGEDTAAAAAATPAPVSIGGLTVPLPSGEEETLPAAQKAKCVEAISTFYSNGGSQGGAMLYIHDYTEPQIHDKQLAIDMIKQHTQSSDGGDVLLYEVFYNYNKADSNVTNYINTDQIYMCKVLRELGYESSSFTYVIPSTASDVDASKAPAEGEAETPATGADGEKAPDAAATASNTTMPPEPPKEVPAAKNTDGVYIISSPSWINKKNALSVWKKTKA